MKNFLLITYTLILLLGSSVLGLRSSFAQSTVKIGLLKYSGGGDWYANPTSLPNLIKFCNQNLNMQIQTEPSTVEPGSRELFSMAMIHMTGHGNVIFSDQEVKNLRRYLEAGGFFHIDDNYGLDPYIRREMKKIFPEKEFVEIPADHPIFQSPYNFPDGLPKIHEHDNKRPQAFGIFLNERLVCFYTYESDLGDGWEEQEVHHDSEKTRLNALRMGANLVHYAFTQ